MQKYTSLEKANMKIEAMAEETEEEDYSIVDAVIASLNLTENMNLALDYRMSGMSYPDIGRMLSRATSTVYEYFIKMRQRYLSTYSGYIYPRCH